MPDFCQISARCSAVAFHMWQLCSEFFEVWSSSLARDGWWLLVVSNLYSWKIEIFWVLLLNFSRFYLSLLLTSLYFSWILFEDLWRTEKPSAWRRAKLGPCARSSTRPTVPASSTSSAAEPLDVRHGLDMADMADENEVEWSSAIVVFWRVLCFLDSTFHGLPGMCPCNEWHVNDMSMTCQWHVGHAPFPPQAILTLKWVCAPEVSVGKARCNIPR